MLFFVLLSLLTIPCLGQSGSICIHQIVIEGNETTNDSYILRELYFSRGDCYLLYDLNRRVKNSEYRLMNTGLVNSVNIEPIWHSEDSIDIRIVMEERGSYRVSANVALPDRNVNIWWQLRQSLLDRLNFSLKQSYHNLGGNNDRVSLIAQVGYTQKIQLQYASPYVDAKQKWGLMLDALFSRQREINYATGENRQLFRVEQDRFLYSRRRGIIGVTYWPGVKWIHGFQGEYHYNTIDPFVQDVLNDQFFLNELIQQYDAIQYSVVMEDRDMIPYPESGYYLRLMMRKEGLLRSVDVNLLNVSVDYRHYFDPGVRLSFEQIYSGRVGLIRPESIPYTHIRALGWERDFIRGYEFYLIDGLDFAYVKNSIRYKLLDINPNLWQWIPFERYRSLPLKVYLTGNVDMGYVNNPYKSNISNTLSNTLLYGGGVGLDFVAYYDMMGRIEISRNHLGETGVFLYYKFGIK